MENHQYNVNLKWVSDRKGEISSPQLSQTIEVATPPEFPKGMESIWSPEHLLTAAVNSCYMTTFLSIAENSKLDFISFDCAAKGILELIEGKFLMTEIVLKPILVIAEEANKERAKRILQKSETECLISNSIKSKVTLETTITF